MNKANMTLWKSKYVQPANQEEFKKVENNYIDNLKQQVYFMEMELKLLYQIKLLLEKKGKRRLKNQEDLVKLVVN